MDKKELYKKVEDLVKRYFFSSYMYGNRRTYHTKEELEAGSFASKYKWSGFYYHS